MTSVEFGSLTALIAAMSATKLRNGLFPRTIAICSGAAAVYVDLPSDLAKYLSELAKQADWPMKLCGRPPGATARNLADLVAPMLVGFDENRRVNRSGPYADGYLLRAATHQASQAILNVLTAAEMEGICAHWGRPAGDSAAAPTFYWYVPRFPPQAAIEKANGMWYGPVAVSHQQCRIFIEHPGEIRGDLSWMRAVDWGPERAAVLLGRKEPRQITIDLKPTEQFLTTIIDVVDIERTPGPRVTVGVASSAAAPFSVRLRLSRPSGRGSIRQVIATMEQELEARRQALLRLKRQHVGEDSRPWTCTYEPLYVYFTARGELPAELQRMLAECCDRGILDSLLYTATDAGGFLPAGADPGQTVHFLMPRSVLETPARDGAHLWLREYAPRHGWTFQLQDQWAAHNLRLFLPDEDQQLQLYPDFAPGPTAALKLRQALTPPGAAPEQSLYLLFDQPAGGLMACCLQTDTLQPFVESCPWHCRAVNTVAADPLPEDAAAAVLTAAIDLSLDNALDAATATISQGTLQRYENDLQQLAGHVARQESLHAAVSRIQAALGEAATEAATLAQHAQGDRLSRDLIRSVRDQLLRLDQRLAGLLAVQEQIATTRHNSL